MLFFSPELILISLWLGMLLDYGLGEPKRWHPLVGFGRLVRGLEAKFNVAPHSPLKAKLYGLLAWLILVLPLPIALMSAFWSDALSVNPEQGGLDDLPWFIALIVNAGLLWFAVGAKSLIQHLRQVMRPLYDGDLVEARLKVGWIVSRDTKTMDEARVVRAAIESGLENGSDAIFAPMFWFLIGGGPLVLLYRFANTLDAMWGYKTTDYVNFGWASARLDDGLNWLPARCCALSYALSGAWQAALHCWRTQAADWESPNAGPVMAAGAGALQVCLGGGGYYHGRWKARPVLGCGALPELKDLGRTIMLLKKTIAYWLGFSTLLLGIVILVQSH